MWVRSDVMSGRNRRWEWRPDAGDAEDRKRMSDASGHGTRASDARLIFADEANHQYCKPTGIVDHLNQQSPLLQRTESHCN